MGFPAGAGQRRAGHQFPLGEPPAPGREWSDAQAHLVHAPLSAPPHRFLEERAPEAPAPVRLLDDEVVDLGLRHIGGDDVPALPVGLGVEAEDLAAPP